MYAKLINLYQLDYAPRTVTVGQTHYNPTPIWWLEENGYKPVIETPMPEQVEGYYWESHWEETEDEIVRVWEQKPIPDEATPEEIAEALESIL